MSVIRSKRRRIARGTSPVATASSHRLCSRATSRLPLAGEGYRAPGPLCRLRRAVWASQLCRRDLLKRRPRRLYCLEQYPDCMLTPDDLRAEYEAIAAHMCQPGNGEVAKPPVSVTAGRLLRDSVEPIATICWWSKEANDEALDLGLSFFERYVRGRAAPLGTSNASVVVSCFGTFEPSLIESVLARRNALVSDDQILQARERGAVAALRVVTDGFDMSAAGWACARLYEAMAGVEVTARPLFAALRSLSSPTDPLGKLWRAAELYREHRGDGNLAASISAGLDRVEMNVLTELWLGYPLGEYSSSRGFAPDLIEAAAERLRRRGWMDADLLTEGGRLAREEIEQATDDTQKSIIEGLGGDVGEVTDVLAVIGRAVVDSGAAPSDLRKRAAG
jgi:hypothetical protein